MVDVQSAGCVGAAVDKVHDEWQKQMTGSSVTMSKIDFTKSLHSPHAGCTHTVIQSQVIVAKLE